MTRLAALVAFALILGGCAARDPGPATFQVPAGRYVEAFDAARDALIEMRFPLDRVDARAGIITTGPKHSAGVATPWDGEQTTISQEWEDFTNEQYRSIRILFEPTDRTEARAQSSPTHSPATDLRTINTELIATIIVVIERKSRPNWRIDTTSIRLSSFASDPLGGGRRIVVPIARDDRLEGRIARRLQHVLDPKVNTSSAPPLQP